METLRLMLYNKGINGQYNEPYCFIINNSVTVSSKLANLKYLGKQATLWQNDILICEHEHVWTH